MRYPPTIDGGLALVGSGDGWVYAFEAASGRTVWRFRAAPVERRIAVYGSLLSTWPASSGVLVDGDRAYFAAGMTDLDGTHVYAVDAGHRPAPLAEQSRPAISTRLPAAAWPAKGSCC